MVLALASHPTFSQQRLQNVKAWTGMPKNVVWNGKFDEKQKNFFLVCLNVEAQKDLVFWFTGLSYLVFTLTYCMYNCLLE